jgi:PAS domain-containing protein
MGAYGLTEKAASFDSPFGGHSIFSKEFDLSADEDGHIVEWKPRAQRLFGYSTDDVKQLRLHDLITPSPDAVIDELHRMLLTESLKLGAEAQRGARFCQVLSFVVQRGLREAAWEITRKGRKRTTVFVRLEVRVLADRLHFFLFVGEPAGSHRDLPTEEMADVGAGPT